MSDVNSNIHINIDTSSASAQLRNLEAQLTAFNNRVISSNAKAVAAQQNALALLQSKIGDTGAFSTSIKDIEGSVARFSKSLEKGKLSFSEYFRYGLASTKKFGRMFDQELATINSTAEDRVKRLSTRYVSLGEDIHGVHQALAIRPNQLDSGIETRLALAAQKQQIFNELLRQGSTHLVNWGKNTQWAGRQLMVGFTVPLTIFAGVAGKIFADLEKQTISFQRVYGDLMTPQSETNAMLEQIKNLSKEYTKYGIAVSDTIKLASDAAAAGAQGAQLITATAQATRLSTLGMIDQQQALKATISMQNAFAMSNEQVAQSVDFLNAVENQTVVSLNDVTQAIPRAAPVIKGLGGDVKDLAVFMAAMQEGGVSAAEGANALKSGLASLINPTKDASAQLKAVGIDLKGIVETNRGDLMGTVMGFAEALNKLDATTRQQVLAKVFGKYQFARLGALFDNITKSGSQAQKVMELTGMSIQDLANLSSKELGKIEQATSVKFTAALEKLKLAIAPIGEMFMKVAIPVINAATKILDVFNSMPNAVKTAVTVIVALFAGIAPVFLMGAGLIANGLGNLVKGFNVIRGAYQRMVGAVSGGNNPLTQSFGYLSTAELDALAAAQGLEGQMSGLTTSLLLQDSAVQGLLGSYQSLAKQWATMITMNPQGFMGAVPGRGRGPRRMATGGFVAGRGNKDTEPALLTPGEFVVNKDAASQYGSILGAMNAGTISKYNDGSPPRRQSGNIGIVQSHVEGATLTGFGTMLKDIINSSDELGKFGKSLADTSVTLYRLEDAGNNNYTIIKEENVALKGLVHTLKGTEKVATPFYKGTMQPSIGARNALLSELPNNPGEPIMAKQLFELEEQVKNNRSSLSKFSNEIDQIILEADQLRAAMKESEDAEFKYMESKLQSILEAEQLRKNGVTAEEAKNRASEQVSEIMQEVRVIYAKEKDAAKATVLAHREAIAGLQHFANASETGAKELIIAEQTLTQNAIRDVATKRTRSPRPGATFSEPRRTNPVAAEVSPSAAGIKRFSSAQWEQVGSEAGIIAGHGFTSTFPEAVSEGAIDAGRLIEASVKGGTGAASPPAWSYELGRWIGQGIDEGMRQTVELPASMTRGAVLLGGGQTSSGTASSVDELGVAAKKATVAIETDAIATEHDALAHERNAQEEERNSTATKENTAATDQNTGAQHRSRGGFLKALYAVDGLSLAMSFLPGPLGELANKVFIVSAALSALDAVIRIDIVKGALTRLVGAFDFAAAQIALSGLKGGAAKKASDIGFGATATAMGMGGAGKAGLSGLKVAAQQVRVAKAVGTAGVEIGTFGKLLGGLKTPFLIFGRYFANIVPKIGLFGKAISLFTGTVVNGVPVIGQIVSALILLGTTLATFGFAYKNVGDKIRDLGDAADLTSDQLKSLGETFGFTPQTTGFAAPGTVLGNTAEARTTAQQAQTYVKEDAAMQEKTRVISEATDQQAAATITAMFNNLIASGAPKEVAISIVEAVANEAGKQKVFVPVQAQLQASFDDKGKIKDIAEYIQTTLNPAIQGTQEQLDKFGNAGFSTVFDQGAVDDAKRWIAAVDMLPGILQQAIVPEYEQKKAIIETAKQFDLLKTSSQSAMNVLSAQFINGNMTAKQFKTGMEQIKTSIMSVGQSQGLDILRQQLADLYPAQAAATQSIDDANIAFQMLTLSASGVNMSGYMQQIAQAGAVTDELSAKIGQLIALQSALGGAQATVNQLMAKKAASKNRSAQKPPGGGGGGGGGNEDPFAARENKLRNQQAEITIKEIKIDRTAEDKFKKELQDRLGQTSITVEGVKIPLKSIKDAEYAITMIGEAIENIQNGPMQQWQDNIDALTEQVDIYQNQLDAINHAIELQQQAISGIEREYKPALDALAAQKSEHEDILKALEDERDARVAPIDDRIAALEMERKTEEHNAKPRLKAIDDQVNALDKQVEAIDEQKDALSKVAEINDYITKQNQSQLDIAEALSTGDVYAAAAAAAEMQSQAADQAMQSQQDALDSQKSDIEDRKKLLEDEKDSIDARIQAITDETDELEYQKTVIEDSYRLRINNETTILSKIDDETARLEKARDARIKPYQDIIDSYAPQIETLNNNIYNKEKEIKDIQDQKLKPLEDQVTALERQKTKLEDINGDIQTGIEREKQQLEARKEYLDQELQILAAKREIADLSSGGGGGGGGGGVSGLTQWTKEDEQKLQDAMAKLQDLKNKFEGMKAEAGATVAENSWWETLMQNAQGAVSSINGLFVGIGKTIYTNLISPINSFLMGIGASIHKNFIEPLQTAFSGIYTNFVQPIGKAAGAIFVAISQLIGEALSSIWSNITESFGEFVSWFTGTVIGGVKKALRTIGSFVSGTVIPAIQTAFKPITDWINTNIITPIKNFWNTISTFISTVVIPAIKNVITPITTWFDQNVIQKIKDAWESIKGFIDEKLIGPVKTAWNNFITWTKKPFDEMVTDVKNFFKNLPSNISKFITEDIPNLFKNAWGDENSGIKAWLLKIKNFFIELPGNIKDNISKLGTMIADAVKSGLKGAITAWNNLELKVPSATFTIAGKDFTIGGITLPTPDIPIPAGWNTGGYVAGSGGRDDRLATLTPGEFVVRKSMVDKYGTAMMNKINNGSFAEPSYQMAGGMQVDSSIGSTNNIVTNAPVYNSYSVNVNASTNASADDIANKVIMKIRQIDSASIRSGRGY